MPNTMQLHSPPRAPETEPSPAGAASRIDDVRRAFFGLEAELGLFAQTAGGCRAWDYLRVEVFDQVIAELGLLGEKHAPPDRRLRAYLREAPGIARSVGRRNPFLCRPVDVLVLGHPRRRLERDGTWWDAYTDPLLAALGERTLLVERPFHNRHLQPARTARIAHLDALALAAAALRRVQRAPFADAEGAVFDQVARALRSELGATVPVLAMARQKLALRQSQLPLWRALLRHLRPRVVVLVVGYGNEIPIEACQSLGIPTVELQHGVISRQNLGYHFPLPGCQKQLFADHLFTFGDFWRTAASFPIPRDRVVSVGFPYLDERRRAHQGVRRRDRALFLSQRSIGARLSRIAVDVARHPDRRGEVVYKLHPGERATWREDYPWLLDAPLQVLETDEPHLYELCAGSTLQVGVYSTALFEGLAFGLSTCIVRLPGCEAMRELVEGTAAAAWADDAGDVVRAFAEAGREPERIDSAAFFRPDALYRARAALRDVMARP